MIYLEVRPKTYTLLFHCPCCEGCMKTLKKIKGVEAPLEVDVYANKVTISVTGDIQTIISELKCKKAMFSKILPDEQNQHEDEPCELQIGPVKNPVQKAMFSKILPDEQNQHEDEPSKLQIVPVKDPVQKATYQQAEFTGVIVRTPKFIVENKYELYSMHEHNGSCSGHAHNGSYSRHEHNLQLKTYNKRFSCDICCEDGYGPRYKWNGHNPYEIHEECKNPKITVTHELFSGSTFELSNRLEHADPCIACGKSVCGRFYHCKESKLNLHPLCVGYLFTEISNFRPA